MSQALRKLTGTISTNCTVFFINQLRENWSNVWKSRNYYWWKCIEVYASVRLDIRRSTQIKDGTSVLGNRTKVKVVAPPLN
jgi:recombination protein RecA